MSVVETFYDIIKKFPEYAIPVAVIKALTTHISLSYGII